jgi:PIN domain nuclease of toxin-antitoxin system
LALLIDTQILVWIGEDDARLSEAARAQIVDPKQETLVSAVTAYEFADLRLRGRFGAVPHLALLLSRLDARVIPLPEDIWTFVEMLPQLHRDPVDRMLIAHAIHSDLTLVTSDETMRRYPVRTIW